MRFIVEESTGYGVANYLRSQGHDVVIVADVWPEAEGSAILQQAIATERIIVTNDKVFGELIFRSGQSHHGIILMRLQNDNKRNRVQVITSLLQQHTDKLADRFTVVTETSTRFRPKL